MDFPGISGGYFPLAANIIAIVLTLLIFMFIGWAVGNVIGRTMFRILEGVLDRVPFVKSVYGGVRRLITTLQTDPEEGKQQRVVLISFPSEEMKTVGLLTRTMKEEGTGRMLAIVYVPTTPNPTSGYLEIVPMDKVVWTDWTLDEAMNFIITGGAVAPDRAITYANAPLRDPARFAPEVGALR